MKKKFYRKILENLILIRKTEELISREYSKNNFRCPVHLSIGQEGISAPINLIFNNGDLLVSSHRAHAHYIGKGCSVKKLLAEILGLVGCSGGIGGSMHLTDKSKGFIMSTAIVANSIPVGVGLSLSQKLEKKKNITLIFFGDGATEQGIFYESINFAALKNLPCLFVCEDNLYSVYSSLKDRQPKRELVKIIKQMGIEGATEDGNDPIKVLQLYQKAKNYILTKKKPFFIKFKTYRYLEHCGPLNDDSLNYRTKREINFWKKKCPVTNYKKFLIEKKILPTTFINQQEKKIELKILKYYKDALNQPQPKQSNLKKILFYEK